MLSISHTLISLPFAFLLENPLLIFLAAAISHLLADTILHWNIYPENFKRYPFILVGLDVIGGVAISWLLLPNHFFTLPVLAAIAGGNSPDILHAFWEFLPAKTRHQAPAPIQKIFQFHDHLQLETTNVIKGLIPQAICITIALLVVLQVTSY